MRQHSIIEPEQTSPVAADCSDGEINAIVEATPEIIARTRSASSIYARLAVVIDTLEARPRFFFHFDCDDHSSRDTCGVELPGLAAAREWAETEARHLLEPEMPLGMDPMNGIITIADEDENILARIAVRNVLVAAT